MAHVSYVQNEVSLSLHVHKNPNYRLFCPSVGNKECVTDVYQDELLEVFLA